MPFLPMETQIKVIPHSQQRYDTCGDYVGERDLYIMVSETQNEDYNFLIGLHEWIEAYLCKKRGIPFDAITKFDIEFKGRGEPGNNREAPYKREHRFATKIEKMVCKELGCDWNQYDQAVQAL